MHVREQIIAAAAAAVTGLATTGANVLESFDDQLQRDLLPCLTIDLHRSTESATPMTMPVPRRFERKCILQVIGHARLSTGKATRQQLNQIALEVEKALAMPAVVGPWKTLTYLATEIDRDGDGEAVTGQVILTYQALYHAAENAPDVAL